MSLSDPYERGFDEDLSRPVEGETCPECDGPLVTEGWETSCSECGLVVEDEPIDPGPEWTSTDEGQPSAKRVGPPMTEGHHDRGLSTEISYGGDASGTPLTARKRYQIYRLRGHQQKARYSSKAEMNLSIAFGEIARLTSALDLPHVVREDASVLYREAQSEDLISGRSIETMTAGAVYATCRRLGFIRMVEEVADVARCSSHKVRLGFTIFNVELGLELRPLTPVEYVPQIASACGASQEVERRATSLAEMASAEGLSNGRNPAGLAAACIYVAGRDSGERLTQSELANAAGVSIVTLRERYRELQALEEDGCD